MSCWVVPGVAADLWGVPLEQVLEWIRLGQVPSKADYHFVLVDVAPHSPQAEPRQESSNQRRPTFRVMSAEELGIDLSDDSAVLEWAGYRVRAIPGDPSNFKITTLGDLAHQVLQGRFLAPEH